MTVDQASLALMSCPMLSELLVRFELFSCAAPNSETTGTWKKIKSDEKKHLKNKINSSICVRI